METVEWGFAATMAAALVSYLLWSARRMQTFLQRLVENHLAHNTRAWVELRNTLTEMKGALNEVTAELRRGRAGKNS